MALPNKPWFIYHTMLLLSVTFFCLVLTVFGLAVISRLSFTLFTAISSDRSGHKHLVRQIGGLIVVPVALTGIMWLHPFNNILPGILLSVAILALWIVGILDDHERFDPALWLRLVVQFVSSGLIAIALYKAGVMSASWLIVPVILVLLIVMTNFTNFMDGLDLMLVVGLGIPLIGVVLIDCTIASAIAAPLAAALVGFALFNFPPASMFLGDSGSQPIGLLAGLALILLGQECGYAPALILPAVFITDSASTLIIRQKKGQNLTQSHSEHAYQIAHRAGLSTKAIIIRIAAVNCVLVCLALAADQIDRMGFEIACLGTAYLIAGVFVWHLRKIRLHSKSNAQAT